jgi:hypothetical protein
MWVGGRTLLVVVAGLAAIAAGFAGVVTVLLFRFIVRICAR